MPFVTVVPSLKEPTHLQVNRAHKAALETVDHRANPHRLKTSHSRTKDHKWLGILCLFNTEWRFHCLQALHLMQSSYLTLEDIVKGGEKITIKTSFMFLKTKNWVLSVFSFFLQKQRKAINYSFGFQCNFTNGVIKEKLTEPLIFLCGVRKKIWTNGNRSLFCHKVEQLFLPTFQQKKKKSFTFRVISLQLPMELLNKHSTILFTSSLLTFWLIHSFNWTEYTFTWHKAALCHN